jgi:hypothetical protein
MRRAICFARADKSFARTYCGTKIIGSSKLSVKHWPAPKLISSHKKKSSIAERKQPLSSPGAAEFEPVPIKQMNSLMSLVRCGVEKWPADSWH